MRLSSQLVAAASGSDAASGIVAGAGRDALLVALLDAARPGITPAASTHAGPESPRAGGGECT